MKILHIIASADPAGGGPIEGALRMSTSLASRGHVHDFFTLDDPASPFLTPALGNVIAAGNDRYRATGPLRGLRRRFGLAPSAIPALQNIIADYDVAIVAGLWNYSTLVARRVLVNSSLPYVVFTHGMLDPWFKQRYPVKHLVKQTIWPINEGVLLRRAAAVLFTCEEERLLARDSFWPYNVRENVVGYGTVDVEGDCDRQICAFRAALPSLSNRRYLLFLSRVHEKKGCDLLIEAFAEICNDHPDLDLVIAGPDQSGLRSVLEKRAAALGITHRIHWPGMIAGDVKWGAYRGCMAFVLPSHQENFGIVIAEAMACAKPVVTTNKVNIWREIAAERAGIIVTDTLEGTRGGLASLLMLDDVEREAMGKRARATFLQKFQLDGFIGGLETILSRAAPRARQTGSRFVSSGQATAKRADRA